MSSLWVKVSSQSNKTDSIKKTLDKEKKVLNILLEDFREETKSRGYVLWSKISEKTEYFWKHDFFGESVLYETLSDAVVAYGTDQIEFSK